MWSSLPEPPLSVRFDSEIQGWLTLTHGRDGRLQEGGT
ncbi:MAG: hypothetical protein AVDCRST_MAG22-1544 [uncultured Rubrobacteraceae bacterium]|uniref:Uncharacterized protein n=1 Tax=uncultured Rubrobacteraceae bacterium TaxID=349277 RepID=A0A6J4P6D4_9ACTN|nr:MAG: hypothetical protein AVDCRST_MAG22-1544 [uncultured Rubrobacteraceae bacterium]